ncbi:MULTISPECIES: hypothetical protein [Yersinia]|uniref:Uncharacterized protein n=1 Tax=Yersinia frederiksenii TaxID=29484 RepID=A0AAI8ZSL2_YERFR|nr:MULTISPECIES: hypothetical protein [Yersinia]EKN3950947.1 hypothetical protein [Yersinia enterocolitica]EKN4139632.1 hypothetical protein [Yersinia enterocolitica]EKN5091257.1 hypothetical protein [Yersinia enterocolitica]EKN5136397.1 hypothetical protein [Yersinia enterocolitica]EKN5150296.1 hypothetical protein [Yersinia enterocolitica]
MTMQQYEHNAAQGRPLSETQVLNNHLAYGIPEDDFFKLTRAKNASALLAALLANHFDSSAFPGMLPVKEVSAMVDYLYEDLIAVTQSCALLSSGVPS